MPRFDPDIIAALAEGRLDAAEAARVEREIASDPAAAAELAAHRTALAALAAAPSLHLSELERAGLRASVADALGLVDAAPAATPVRRRAPWASLGIAAAALFGLVAIVPVVGLLNTGGGGDESTALAPEATTAVARDVAAAGEENLDGATSAPVPEGALGFDPTQEAPGGETDGFGTTTSAGARSTTTTTPPADSIVTEGDSGADTTVAPDAKADLDDLLGALTSIVGDPAAVEELAVEAPTDGACWAEDTAVRDPEAETLWTFEYVDGEQLVIVYFEYDADGNAGPFVVYDPADCTALAEIIPEVAP